MLDVRDKQFLVLLLMMKADLDAPSKLIIEIGAEKIEDGGVDSCAVAGDLVVARSRQKPARWTGVLLADRAGERPSTPAGPSTNVSKNHVVCARCHLVGLASGML
jgi:hypothetical protein